MNMLGLSSILCTAHVACYWKFFLLHYIKVLCQYRLRKADNTYLMYIMPQRQLSPLNGHRLHQLQVSLCNGSLSSSYSLGTDRVGNVSSIISCVSLAEIKWKLLSHCLATGVFVEMLPSNGSLWFHNSGFQQTWHSTMVAMLMALYNHQFQCTSLAYVQNVDMYSRSNLRIQSQTIGLCYVMFQILILQIVSEKIGGVRFLFNRK
jgi:hypothetical protein